VAGEPPVEPLGCTPEEALRRWCDPVTGQEMRRLASEGYNGPTVISRSSNLESEYYRNIIRYCELRSQQEAELLEKLRAGRLVAVGYDSRLPIDAPPIAIPSGRWPRALSLNFSESTATGGGLTVLDIQIFEGLPDLARAPPVRSGRAVSQAKVVSWYLEWVKKNSLLGKAPSRKEDMAAAREIFGTHVTRELLRELRRDVSPEEWRRSGRRKLARETGDNN